MLKQLIIKNYAIIESVILDFHSDLNIITGETGAGKSIILGALGLIMGKRADRQVLYQEDEKCVVEAHFQKYPSAINELLQQNDFDVEDELIIRREISASGKSRAFVNDTPTRLEMLQSLSVLLIDLNSQFEIREIQNASFQLNMVDALAKNQNKKEAYRNLYKEYKDLNAKISNIKKMSSAAIKEIDFLKFQFDEMAALNLELGEKEQLEEERKTLDKAEELSVLAQETHYLINEGEQNLRSLIQDLTYRWQKYQGISQLIDDVVKKMDEAQFVITEIDELTSIVSDQAEADPQRLLELERRLDDIYSLERKHQVNSVEALIAIRNEMEIKINAFDNSSDELVKLEKQLESCIASLDIAAQKLTDSRKSVLPQLTRQVNKRLDALAMSSAEIKIEHLLSESFKSDGKDDISFLFKANKGGQFAPIKKVASGGESSRLMLSIKSIIGDAMHLPTMIFDEIDTGVSGEIAGKMGDILKEMSHDHQLISITHSPQVASRADQHYFVFKSDTKERTITHVKMLEGKERIVEIAKMLSGDPPSEYALKNAKELINS